MMMKGFRRGAIPVAQIQFIRFSSSPALKSSSVCVEKIPPGRPTDPGSHKTSIWTHTQFFSRPIHIASLRLTQQHTQPVSVDGLGEARQQPWVLVRLSSVPWRPPRVGTRYNGAVLPHTLCALRTTPPRESISEWLVSGSLLKQESTRRPSGQGGGGVFHNQPSEKEGREWPKEAFYWGKWRPQSSPEGQFCLPAVENGWPGRSLWNM